MRNAALALLGAALALAVAGAPARAAEDASCQKPRLVDVGWSDIAATTGIATVLLEALGYGPSTTIASLPVALTGMKNGRIDIFLGYWKPAMTPVIEPFVAQGHVQVLDTPNLAGARYTLAVPTYLYDRGLKTFADIARFQKELDGRILGIEPGTDGNALIQRMIRDDRFGLKNFRLVESSEADMLAEVQRALRARKAVLFLGWEPHPMNVQLKMSYLAGGDEVFGPNQGEARVYTVVRAGYLAQCPNVAALLNKLQFSAAMESQLMAPILEKARPVAAARNFLRKNPAVVEPWLTDVKTFDGRDGREAVAAALRK